jgi:hypothetical protein
VEVQAAADAHVGALPTLALGCPSAHQTDRPPLELVGVVMCEGLGVLDGGRLAGHRVGLGHFLAEGVVEPVLHQAHRRIGDVGPDPAALQPLCDSDGGSAATERVEHHITLIAAGGDDAFEQGFRLLCRGSRDVLCPRRLRLADQPTRPLRPGE